MTTRESEWLTCAESPLYFTAKYTQIYDVTAAAWIPFGLWPAQARTLKTVETHPLTVILKARQLGLTWLVLSYALWLMLFRPAATVLLFSRRDDEAVHLLDDRLKGMYKRLPLWMQARSVVEDNDHEFGLSNESVARAFPTSAGDSYTAGLAIVDEADLIPDLNRLMRAVKPTIDGGGRMILLSRADKTQPESEFKAIYRGAKAGASPWTAVFLPWHVRPSRNDIWYEAQQQDVLARTGFLDDLYEQYPATDLEALSPRSADKRIPYGWLADCFTTAPKRVAAGPALPSLSLYVPPADGAEYVIGADPAEGNPTSDDSAAVVLDRTTGEEVASLAGKFETTTFAAYLDELGRYYHDACVLVERNNHGHAVLGWLADHSELPVLAGADRRAGWLSSSLGKALMYSSAANQLRDGEVVLHTERLFEQLASISGSTLRAPDGQHDDLSDAFALAVVGREIAAGMTPTETVENPWW